MKNLSLQNKWLVGILFLILFTYLILRALFVLPYVDELTSLFEFIEPDKKWNESLSSISANNHLLTTFLSKLMYSISGDRIFFLRIPSLLAFVLFFFSSKSVISKCVVEKHQLVVFISLHTIAWIFEYFGYIRGYGLALGFFFSAFACFYQWAESKDIKYFIFFLLSLWLSFFANLSVFNSIAIFAFYTLLYLIFNYSKFSKLKLVLHFLLFFLFVYALVPLIEYSFDLKEAGALWWGSLNGMWDCTGFSLVHLTFFDQAPNLKVALMVFYLLIGFIGIYSLIKKGFKTFLFSMEGILYVLLFGNLILIEFLAIFFEVNYPHDRAALLLVIFTLLVFSVAIQRIKFLNYSLWLLLYFPISFVMEMNLSTSVYQKNHRTSEKTTTYLKHQVDFNDSYSVGDLIAESRFFQLRNEKKAPLFDLIYPDLSVVQPNHLIVDRINFEYKIPTFYSLITSEEVTGVDIYKDTRKLKYTQVMDTVIKHLNTDKEFVGLIDFIPVSHLFGASQFKFQLSGTIMTKDNSSLCLITTLGDSLDRNKYYNMNELYKISNVNRSVNFVKNSPNYVVQPDKPNLCIFFWNRGKNKIQYDDIHLKIYKTVVGE
jgi:hypothetical protein